MNKIYQNYQTTIMVGIFVLSAVLLSVFVTSVFATSPSFSGLAISVSGKTATVSFNYNCAGDSYCEGAPDQQFPATVGFVDSASSCTSSGRTDYSQLSLTKISNSKLSGTVNVDGRADSICVRRLVRPISQNLFLHLRQHRVRRHL